MPSPAGKAARIAAVLPALRGLCSPCRLCARRCGADRLAGGAGFCRAAGEASVSVASHTLHFGEEPALVGAGGSGTVFFSGCNMACVYCQNHQISQEGLGRPVTPTELAAMCLALRDQGAENINLVTPTHVILPVLLALREACLAGLDLPLVYNTNGYDSPELLALLEGVVDIYLPDLKYTEEEPARRYSAAPGYPAAARLAVREMWRQAGPLELGPGGAARRGLVIRHLVLPRGLAGSYEFLLWLRDEGMTGATVCLMSQYGPRHRAGEFPELAAPLCAREYDEVVRYALDLGFEDLLVQGLDSAGHYLPDFSKERPFG